MWHARRRCRCGACLQQQHSRRRAKRCPSLSWGRHDTSASTTQLAPLPLWHGAPRTVLMLPQRRLIPDLIPKRHLLRFTLLDSAPVLSASGHGRLIMSAAVEVPVDLRSSFSKSVSPAMYTAERRRHVVRRSVRLEHVRWRLEGRNGKDQSLVSRTNSEPSRNTPKR